MAVEPADDLLRNPSSREYPSITRTIAPYVPQRNYDLAKGEEKHYQQQFSDMYFLRLAKLKPVVEAFSEEAWDGYQIAGDTVHKVDRVLDVRQGELCWVAGTVYMDMPLKPNILDDISKDHWIAAPPPREKYTNPNGQDKVMLEDESGRLRLIGRTLDTELLVTGCIIAVMGTENADGDFEVIDIKVPDLPRQPTPTELEPKPVESSDADTSMSESSAPSGKGKVAIISGLNITGTHDSLLSLDLLLEFLLGESTSPTLQHLSASISRLIIAGNSIADSSPTNDASSNVTSTTTKKSSQVAKKYGYDSSAYNPAPTTHLDTMLATLLPSLPVTLMPGPSDPANVSIPQQPLHPALFPQSRAYAAPPSSSLSAEAPTAARKPRKIQHTHPLHPATNPTFFTLGSHLFLGHAGQPVDDIAKYISSDTDASESPSQSASASQVQNALDIMEATLRWRLIAPTAPDTLWCYPYQEREPFVLEEGWCPHVYFAGNQAGFGTRVVQGPGSGDDAEGSGSIGETVRLISVPKFSETGEVVVLDLEDLSVQRLCFRVHGESLSAARGGVGGDRESKDFFAGM